jgi:hypothetical protein
MRSIDVNMKFKGMRKPQEFTIYPVLKTEQVFFIQSNQRIGRVNLDSKTIYLSKGRSSGSYGPDLCEARGAKMIQLTDEEFRTLLNARDRMAGLTNNDGTLTVLG